MKIQFSNPYRGDYDTGFKWKKCLILSGLDILLDNSFNETEYLDTISGTFVKDVMVGPIIIELLNKKNMTIVHAQADQDGKLVGFLKHFDKFNNLQSVTFPKNDDHAAVKWTKITEQYLSTQDNAGGQILVTKNFEDVFSCHSISHNFAWKCSSNNNDFNVDMETDIKYDIINEPLDTLKQVWQDRCSNWTTNSKNPIRDWFVQAGNSKIPQISIANLDLEQKVLEDHVVDVIELKINLSELVPHERLHPTHVTITPDPFYGGLKLESTSNVQNSDNSNIFGI
jgi:hypothetical protein